MATRTVETDDNLLYQVAKMYYIDGMTQDAVARRVSLSRSYVSRLLERAKERGIVTFVVTNPTDRVTDDLARRLCAAFDLKFAAVEYVQSNDLWALSPAVLSERIARKAASVLPAFLATSKAVAVGTGATVYAMSKLLEPTRLPGEVLFVPAIGNVATSAPQIQANIIVDNVSSAFSASRYFTNVPVITDADEVESNLFARRYRELVQRWNLVDTAIVSIGAPYRSLGDSFTLNEATEEYRELVANADTVGDILTSFFFEDGTEIGLSDKFARNAMSLQRLRDIDRVLCVAGGPRKVRGIRAAMRHGFVNCLVTDSVTATQILELEGA